MSDQTPTTGTLVKKLAEVMSLVGKIKKEGFNEHFRYKFVREADLVEKLSELLAERHLFITSSTKGIESVELSKVNNKTGEVLTTKMGILRIEYTFHDGDSGETLTMESVGEIDQDGGKGLYKALTGSMKYFLMKNFLVATGDDPEQSHVKPLETAKAVPAKKPAEKKPPTALHVMESLTKCEALKPLGQLYDRAFTAYTWTPQEAASISTCYLSCYGKLSNWPLHDDQCFFSATGEKHASIQKDAKTGKVTVVEGVAQTKPAKEEILPPSQS